MSAVAVRSGSAVRAGPKGTAARNRASGENVVVRHIIVEGSGGGAETRAEPAAEGVLLNRRQRQQPSVESQAIRYMAGR